MYLATISTNIAGTDWVRGRALYRKDIKAGVHSSIIRVNPFLSGIDRVFMALNDKLHSLGFS